MDLELLQLCLLIFFARIADVSIGTIRYTLIDKDQKVWATIAAFLEIIIWFTVVKNAINTDANSLYVTIAYASGYATGTLIGMWLSDLLVTGNLSIQVITDDNELSSQIRDHDFAVSTFTAEGYSSKKYMLFIEINKKKQKALISLIKQLDPNAFIVINESKSVHNGYIR